MQSKPGKTAPVLSKEVHRQINTEGDSRIKQETMKTFSTVWNRLQTNDSIHMYCLTIFVRNMLKDRGCLIEDTSQNGKAVVNIYKGGTKAHKKKKMETVNYQLTRAQQLIPRQF